jgi:hypothetical membrane protein
MTNKQYAIIGFLSTALFWLTYLILANQRPEYSFLTKAISELGSVDAPNKWAWNVLGYIIPGIFISIYSLGLYKNITNNASIKLPFFGILFSGIGMSISGLFPGDFENPKSLTMSLHTIGSFGSYLFFLIGAFTYPKLMKKSMYWGNLIKPTLLFTWLTIIFGSWPFIFTSFPAVGQRIVFFFYFLWIFYTALKLYKQPEST